MTETLMYVVLFVALFFQVFLLLTYLGREARERRLRVAAQSGFPAVAVVVPCYNEETTIRATAESLLALDYPAENIEIILVNDGSTDGTRAVLDELAADPRITVIHKENGGKHSCINIGIEQANAEFIGCLDADSFVHPGALKELIPHFEDPRVAAVTSSMSVHNPQNPLERMQYAEYLIGITLRHVLSAVNGLHVTPGPFSFYRKSILQEIGGFRHAHQTEDMEMALRIQKNGYLIENAPRAQVFTKAPRTLWGLLKQRTRWTSGFMRNAYDYRSMIGNPRHGVLGLLTLPLGVLSILTGIILFVLSIVQTTNSVVQAINIKGDVPLAFALSSVPHLDWFYVPVTGLLLLGIVAVGIIATTMVIAKRISGVPGSIGIDVVWYVVLYSIVAPLWLMRSARDVAFSINRSWR